MSEDAECPPHEHIWSLLTSADGVRQCLVDGCYAVRESAGGSMTLYEIVRRFTVERTFEIEADGEREALARVDEWVETGELTLDVLDTTITGATTYIPLAEIVGRDEEGD